MIKWLLNLLFRKKPCKHAWNYSADGRWCSKCGKYLGENEIQDKYYGDKK